MKTFQLATLFVFTFSFAQAYLDCRDSQGIQISYVVSFNSNQAAASNVNNYGQPIIIINPNIYNQLSPAIAGFVNAHECAHHYYGHVYNMTHRIPRNPFTDEFDADCFAVKFLRDTNQLNQNDFEQIKGFLNTLHADESHPSGYDRIQYAIQCANSY